MLIYRHHAQSLYNIMYFFATGPFANYLAVKTSFRATMFVGGVLLGIGYAASYFVERLEYLLLSLGIVAGNLNPLVRKSSAKFRLNSRIKPQMYVKYSSMYENAVFYKLELA